MNRKQIEKIIELLAGAYVTDIQYGLHESARETKKELKEFEKQLKEGDYFP